MTTAHTVAVLGLGRMGAAIARRLTEQGREVVGWTRSGRSAGDIPTTDKPAGAVAGADLVLLALFDGHACRDVLDAVRDALRPGTVVVNTSTIAPAEAEALAEQHGPSYVHAPVLGSTPAVAAGSLQVLAAGADDAFDKARPVLEQLGNVRHVADARTAAALKLVVNSTIAGSVLALGETLRQADALGLPREQVLDVLELSQLGKLAAAKRPFLADPSAAATRPAQFTIGALTKDMDLLTAASGAPLPSAAALAEAPAGPHADIAAAATAPAVDDAVLAPLRAYMRGHATGDPAHFRAAFLPTARIEGLRDGTFVSWDLDDYCALFPGHPAPDEAARTRRIDAVTVHGTVATAAMTLRYGPETFTDVFLLARTDGDGWRIASKAYHRHT